MSLVRLVVFCHAAQGLAAYQNAIGLAVFISAIGRVGVVRCVLL